MKSFFKRVFQWIWHKKRWILAVLVILGGAGFWFGKKYFRPKQGMSFVSSDHVVTTGDIIRSLALGGTTQFANSQKLNFIEKGKITSVLVKVGDKVKKGDILATISSDADSKDRESTMRNLRKKEEELQKLEKNNIKNRELDIKEAEIDYEKTVQELNSLPQSQKIESESKLQDLKEKKKNYERKLSKRMGTGTSSFLEIDKKEEERKKETTYLSLIRALRNDAQTLSDLLDGYDKLLKISQKYEEDTQNIYIGAKVPGKLTDGKAMFWELKKYIEILRTSYTTLSQKDVLSLSEDDILEHYNIYPKIAQDLNAWAKVNAELFRGSIKNSSDNAELQIDDAKIDSWVKTYSENILSNYKWIDEKDKVRDTLRGLSDTVPSGTTKEEELARLKRELDKLQLEYQDLTLTHQATLIATEKKVIEKKNSLEDIKKGGKSKEAIDDLKSQIKDIRENLAKQNENTQLIANFDGIITKVNMQVGDSVSPSASSDTMKYISVETPDLLHVNLDIDQIDIVKVHVGMPVQVYLDTFPDQVYSGTFTEIDTMPEGSSYKAKVVFHKNDPEEKILGGMSANVKITLEEEKGKIVVPNPALADNSKGEKIVRLKKGETWVDQVVEIGIADEVNTVVLSGLKLGDTIKGLYMNETSMANAGIIDGGSSERTITTHEDGSMSYEFNM